MEENGAKNKSYGSHALNMFGFNKSMPEKESTLSDAKQINVNLLLPFFEKINVISRKKLYLNHCF